MDDIWPDTSHKVRDAYYQAGHAVVALRESLGIIRVSLENGGNASSWIDVTYPLLCQSRLSRSARAHSDAKSVIRALLAGPAALERYSFGTLPVEDSLPEFDLGNARMMEQEAVRRAIALAAKISKDSPSLIRSLWRQVTRLIHGDEVWPAIEAVADSLIINGELAGCEVCRIAQHAFDPQAGCT